MTSHAGPVIDYDNEIRFGVVMYGGVSLAIYIYGVSAELFELACATPLRGTAVPPEGLPAPPDAAAGDGGTREVYRRLSRLASDPPLRHTYAARLKSRPAASPAEDLWDPAWDDGPATRFVLDVIAGTSAGGINGIYLAKALSLGRKFSALEKLWVHEGDIDRLLNDDQAANGLPGGLPSSPDHPKSLLSSDRMYRQLLEALEAMHGDGSEAGPSPLVEALDLYVTTTDIQGAPVELRLFDKVVLERRHRQRFHFSYPSRVSDRQADDFDRANHPFLAFAARCTSSFPFAFEPMTLAHVSRLVPAVSTERRREWRRFFDAFSPGVLAREDWDQRAFGDGGYLDNKPFSFVVEALSQRFGDCPAQRKLIYVEPDPERLDADFMQSDEAPDALSNALAALTSIPQYETIREDLLAVLQRNRRIERVERLLSQSERDVEGQVLKAGRPFDRVRCIDGEIRSWTALSLDDMLHYYGSGFLPYRRLRVYSTSDWLAAQLAGAFGIDPESDHGYALRAVVRAWRDDQFEDNPPPGSDKRSFNAFLLQYDLDYVLRRIAFVMRRVDQLSRLAQAAQRGTGAGRSELEDLLASKLVRVFKTDVLAEPESAGLLLNELRSLKRGLRQNHRRLLAVRQQWARGQQVSRAVEIDDSLRVDLKATLGRLLGDPSLPPGHSGTLPTADGHQLPLPEASDWLQSRSAAYSLQDSVFARVRTWLDGARTAHQSPLLLWQALNAALKATRIAGKRLADPIVDQLRTEQEAQLGRPRLAAVELEATEKQAGDPRTHRAELVVDDPEPSVEEPRASIVRGLRRLLGEYYLSFDAFDQTRFTLYYGTDTGEPTQVDIVRVSPADAGSLRSQIRDRLAGDRLGHFGAFLDAGWRRNDIMWGRLDGAERVLRTVLPAEDPDTQAVRQELLRLAQGCILKQTYLAQATDTVNQRRLAGVLTPPAPPASPQELEALKRVQLHGDQLRLHVQRNPTFDGKLPADRTLATAARAVTITGRLLEGISKARSGRVPLMARWLSRLGLLLQAAVAVALPGGLAGPLFRRILALLYFVEVVLVAIAMVLGDAQFRSASLGALIATIALHLVVLVVGDVMRNRHAVLKTGAALVALGLLALAGAGGVALKHRGFSALSAPSADRPAVKPEAGDAPAGCSPGMEASRPCPLQPW